MYEAKAGHEGTAAIEEGDVETLEHQLAADASAALRDMYLDRLHLAAEEIGVAVAEADRADDAQRVGVLRELGRAVATGEAVLLEVWNSYHGVGGRAAR
jgi:hypothetical protein